MPDPTPTPNRHPAGGGFFFIAALMAGVVIGLTQGQPTIGFLVGAAVGAAILLAMWLIARR